MKRIIALLLALVLCCSMLAACGGEKTNKNEEETKGTEPVKVEDDGVMKILMIGHSLGIDSTFMLPDVAKQQGMTNLVVGVIYHSGCRLHQHVGYIQENAAQYAYYEFDASKDTQWQRADSAGGFVPYETGTATDSFIEDGSIAQTMQFGIKRHDWDLVVLQAGVFEAANVKDSDYSIEIEKDINTLTQYVKDNDIEPGSAPEFAWNITWTCPGDEMLNDSYRTHLYNNFTNADEMYEAIVATAKDTVVPAYDFKHVFPSGTVMQNARSSKLGHQGLYRDTIHANDFGRLMVAYAWYCMLTGTDIESLQIGPISSPLLLDGVLRLLNEPMELTEEQKQILVESVKNAMANPYAMTQSAY